jgi:hypothetical protein
VVLASLFFSTAGSAGQTADDRPSGKPLQTLARICEVGSDKERLAALKEISGRDSIWARDLLCRHAPGGEDFVKGHLPQLILAALCSNFSSRPHVRKRLRTCWADATPGREGHRAQVLAGLKRLCGRRPTGFREHRWTKERQELLKVLVTREDRDHNRGALLELLGGPKWVTTGEKKLLKEIEEGLRRKSALESAVLVEKLGLACKATAGSPLFAAEFDPLSARAVRLLVQDAKEGSWKQALGNTRFLCTTCAAVAAVSDALKDAPCKSRPVFMAAFVSAAMAVGGKADRPELMADAGKMKKAIALESSLFVMALNLRFIAPQAPKMPKNLVPPGAYKEVRYPFSWAMASLEARLGGAEAAKWLGQQATRSAKRLEEASRTLKSAREAKDKGGEQSAAEKLTAEVRDLRGALVMADFAHRSVRAPGERLVSAVTGCPREFGSMIPLLDVHSKQGSWGKAQRKAEIRKIKQAYRTKAATLGAFVSRMAKLEALGDKDLFKAYKDNPEQLDTVVNELAAIRMIGLRGGPKDSALLNRYWFSGKENTEEAVAAAAEAKGYRQIVEMLLRSYPKMDNPRRRRLVIHMAWHVFEAGDLPTFFEMLKTERDEKCLEYLALGVLRLCREGKGAGDCIRALGAKLKVEPYGRRWFYMASVLRALVPQMKLKLNPDTEKGIAARNGEIDRAVDQALKQLKAKEAGYPAGPEARDRIEPE